MKLSDTRRKPVRPRLRSRGNFDSDLRAARARGKTHRKLSRDPFKKTHVERCRAVIERLYVAKMRSAREEMKRGEKRRNEREIGICDRYNYCYPSARTR